MSLFDLHGKNALVTGASSGIGKQVALAYAQAGAAVAIAARHQEPLQELAAEIVAGGGTAVPIACDVTQPEPVATMLNRVNDELGEIDIAVCNAGIIALNSLLDMPLEEFQSIQNTNVNGVFLTAQARGQGHGRAAARGNHHQHGIDVGPHRQHPAAGRPLLRLEGSGHSADQGYGCGVRALQHPGQQRQPRLHPYRIGGAPRRVSRVVGNRRSRSDAWAGPRNSSAYTSISRATRRAT
jgi:NAD(P)-dependent dehydrogenase (short-subunit alcohol dehydrogenase family)